jgi:hypothetical protein
MMHGISLLGVVQAFIGIPKYGEIGVSITIKKTIVKKAAIIFFKL